MSPILESPNSEFVNNYNLMCMVDLPGDILPCEDHLRCAYYTGHSSIYETVETQLYVCSKCTTKKGRITSYFNVCFPCHAKGNHKRHMKHMTVDDT